MASTYYDSAAAHPTTERASRLPTLRLAAFSAAAVPLAAAHLPLTVYLPAIYAQHFGLSLTALGAIFLFAKLWGAVTDPIIGSLSDRTRGRFGRRRPWIVAGGAIFGLSAVLLFFPVLKVTPVYLAITLFVFYLGWSMLSIPYLAWSGEISSDYNERTRVATYQAVAGAVTLLAVLLLPTIVDHVRPADNALKLGVMGGALLVALVPSLILTLRAFPEPPRAAAPAAGLNFWNSVRLVAGNALLMRVLASDFAVTLGQSIRGALFVFFVSIYMGLPQWASGLFLIQFVFGILAGPLWMRIGYRFGKHSTAVAGEIVQALVNLSLLLVVPGQFGLLLFLTITQGLAQGSGNLMLRAMVADVADQHRLSTGEDRAALFFSVFSISAKAGMAAAVGLALPLVAWFGFDPKLAQNTPEALRGLLLVFALGPAVAHLLSAVSVYGFPLDANAHAEIRRGLARLQPSSE